MTEQKIFDLPTHPTKGPQCIIVERPSTDSVWYLVIDDNASIPLVKLMNPKNPKDVLEALEQQNGSGAVQDYIMNGWSKLNWRGDDD